MWKKIAVTILGLFSSACPLMAQNSSEKLALLIPHLFGPNGLTVDTNFKQFNHNAHFINSFESEFPQFNISLASQLTALPLPSPASGFTYSFDPASGAFSRSAQSFGPILAERAETIGKNKVTVGFSYQRFSFDSIEGGDLNQVRAVFNHEEPVGIPPNVDTSWKNDIIATVNTIRNTFDQATFYATYGVTDRLDVSVAVPTVHAELNLFSSANIQRLSGSNPNVHYFADASAPGGFGSNKTFASSGSATGLGDIQIRVKGRVAKWEHAGLAVGMDFRLPTGDEMNLLGTGTAGYKPFVALSFPYGRISPHVNVAYQWNGESVLAGDPVTGTKGPLPDLFTYIGGLDVGALRWMTFSFDVLGQTFIDSPRLVRQLYDSTQFETIGFTRENINTVDGAFGIKLNPGGNLLINLNLLFKMNESGLRDKLTPLVGIAYTF